MCFLLMTFVPVQKLLIYIHINVCILDENSGYRTYIHPCKRSRSEVKGQGKKVTTQLNRFQTVTPIWIYMWWWNDTYSLILLRRGALLFLAATKQLYKWYFLSICWSVCHTFLTMFSPCSHHRIIMKFSGVITMDRSEVHAKYQGQRSKVKVTEVNTQLSRFRTLTPVWIHI